MNRNSIEWFASRMESKLKKNDDTKGECGWKNMSLTALFSRLMDEVKELKIEMSTIEPRNKQNIIDECADIANFCMMIADNVQEEK